jgi:c(7)-type cytochrome triheme protein
MRVSWLVAFVMSFVLVGGLALFSQEKKTPPPSVTWNTKAGTVVYDHAAHAKREKEDCKVCHDKLFPQSADKAQLKFMPHPASETKKASCGFCHRPGGTAFATKGNCTKCHQRGGAKKG